MRAKKWRSAALAAAGIVWAVGGIARSAKAAIAAADLLVTNLDSGVMTDYTTAGAAVQTFAFPSVESGGFHDLRDVAVSVDRSAVYAYNGTFTPQMSTSTVSTGAINGRSFTGWNTANNISYGGIGVYGTGVFVTDQQIGGDAANNSGIVRFDAAGGATARFGAGTNYQDLTIGGNGFLYALRGDGKFDVYSPLTNSLIRTVSFDNTAFSADIRGLAVRADGTIYAAGWDGSVYALNPYGVTLRSMATGDSNLTDIDLNDAGQLLVGSRFGNVILTTTALTAEQQFTISSGPTIHVAFATPLTAAVPEPATVAVLAMALAATARRRSGPVS